MREKKQYNKHFFWPKGYTNGQMRSWQNFLVAVESKKSMFIKV